MSEEKTAWEKYLEKINKEGKIETPGVRGAKPWDLINPKIERVPEHIAEKRYEICKKCPEFRKFTTQCSICNCFMGAKTKLPNASCPLHKWKEYFTEEYNGILPEAE